MKRAATIFFSFFVIFLVSNAYGQSRHLTPDGIRKIQNVGATHIVQMPTSEEAVFQGFFNKMSPLVAEDQLSYFATDGSTMTLPLGDTLLDSLGNVMNSPGDVPYVRWLQGERFTPTEISPMLDSFRVRLNVNTIGTHTSNKVVFQIIGQELLATASGDMFPYPNPNVNIKTVNLFTTKMHDHSIVDTIVKFPKPGVKILYNGSDTLGDNAGMFYIVMAPFYPDNQISILSDSNLVDRQNATLDSSVLHTGWVAYDANVLAGQAGYFTRGIYLGASDPQDNTSPLIFPNFYITAYLHEGAAAAVDDVAGTVNTLAPNMPNPVSNTTEITYSNAKRCDVSLKLFNSVGEEITTIESGVQSAGPHTVAFDASKLSNGVYYYKLQAGEFVATRTMVVAK